MDSRRPAGRPSRPNHPNTLGEAWRRASQPRRPKADDLPALPDWPPLREERVDNRSLPEWPSLGPSPSLGERLPARDEWNAARDGADWSSAEEPQPAHDGRDTQRPALALWRRWRGASRKAQVAVVAAILLPLLLIAGCSSLALHALNDTTLGASSTLLGAQATQQASATGAAPVIAATSAAATHAPASAPTSAPTSAATSTPNQTLTLSITCASGSVSAGTGKVCVQTQPSAALTLSVRYCDGTDAKGLHGGATADSTGAYTWTWPVRPSSCVGAATATVTARWQGKTASATNTFTITK